MDDARFHDLLDRYHDGDATVRELSELESRMAGDAGCRRLFVERNLMEVQLRKSFASSMAGRAPARRSLRRRTVSASSPWMAGAVAAAALFAALLLFASMPSTPPQRTAVIPPLPEPEPVAPPRREPKPLPPPVLPEARPAPIPPPAMPAPEPVRREEAAPRKAEIERPAPAKPAPAETRAAVAMVVEGEAVGLDGTTLAAGRPLLAGQGFRIGEGAVLRLRFADGTQAAFEGPSEISSPAGKRLAVDRGTVRAQVSKQPAGQPLVFVTPHVEARVLGTALKLRVDGTSTRLEVTEGKVQLKRLRDGWTVDVAAGFTATAAPGVEMSARALPITDVHLASSQGQISGDEWRAVKDEQAAAGLLLESVATANFAVMTLPIDHAKIAAWFAKGRSRSWVTFTFAADADTDYFVWVRGRCTGPPGPSRLRNDDVILEAADAAFVRRPADWKPMVDHLSAFNGYGAKQGFWWSGGCHDPGNTESPIAVRFKRSGRQMIRMHAMETPIQIDAIWLSTTKATRPGAEEVPGKR